MTLSMPQPPETLLLRDLVAARRLFAPIASAAVEIAAFAYLDPEWRLLGMRHTTAGSRDTVRVPVRVIAADAIGFDAVGVIMAHNHPSGEPAPTDADLAVTRRLARALDAIGVRLLDHVVLAGRHCASLRAMGLL